MASVASLATTARTALTVQAFIVGIGAGVLGLIAAAAPDLVTAFAWWITGGITAWVSWALGSFIGAAGATLEGIEDGLGSK